MQTRSQVHYLFKEIEESDKYDNKWALKKDNYCRFVPNELKLLQRVEMIDKIYEVYDKLVKLIPETLSPDKWKCPPKYCYENQLTVQLKDIESDLCRATNKRKKKKTTKMNFNLYGKNIKSGFRNKYHGWTGDAWDNEFNGHERPSGIEKLEEEDEDSVIAEEMKKYKKHYTGYAMDGFISDEDDYEF